MSRSKWTPAEVVAVFLGIIGVVALSSCVFRPTEAGVYAETSTGWTKLPSSAFDAPWGAFDEAEGLSLDSLPRVKRNGIIVLNGTAIEPSAIYWGRNLRLAEVQIAGLAPHWASDLDSQPVTMRALIDGGHQVSTKRLPPGIYALVAKGATETRGYFFRK